MVSIKATSLTRDTLSMESQRMSGKLKSPEITILSKWSQTSCTENYRIHPSNLDLHWVAYSKNRIKFFDQ